MICERIARSFAFACLSKNGYDSGEEYESLSNIATGQQ